MQTRQSNGQLKQAIEQHQCARGRDKYGMRSQTEWVPVTGTAIAHSSKQKPGVPHLPGWPVTPCGHNSQLDPTTIMHHKTRLDKTASRPSTTLLPSSSAEPPKIHFTRKLESKRTAAGIWYVKEQPNSLRRIGWHGHEKTPPSIQTNTPTGSNHRQRSAARRPKSSGLARD